MDNKTSSEIEPAQQVNVKCTLFVEELLSIEGLRKGHLCSSCLLGIGTHARKPSDYRTTNTILDDRSQIGFTSGKQEIQLTTSTDASISPPDNDKQSKPTRSFTSQSNSSSSMASLDSKSLDSNNANLRIDSAPLSPNSEAVKKTEAIERQLKNAALLEASIVRTKKMKSFLAKYCCPHIVLGTNAETIYERISARLTCRKRRLYYLTQHARHNCLNLFQFANTEDNVVKIFELLDSIIPKEVE